MTSTARALLPCAFALLVAGSSPDAAVAQENRIDSFVLIDQLEYFVNTQGTNALRFNAQGWVGGDYNRLWVNTEGTRVDDGKLEDTDVQLLYGRLIAPFWDLQAGVRYFHPKSGGLSRASGVFGIQGIAPYWFDVQAAGFVSQRGEVSARLEVEYDLLLTQRLILQPRLETNAAIQEVKSLGIGRGINDLELGLRLRYEITRQFAPYIGVSWTNQFGGTASLTRAEGGDVRNLGMVLGIRAWF